MTKKKKKKKKKIIIFTDAWSPQINGVATTYYNVTEELRKMGIEVEVITPNQFKQFDCPFYKELKIARPNFITIFNKVREARRGDDYIIHISTEGPIGILAALCCKLLNIEYSTSFHTNYGYYLKKYCGMPEFVTVFFLRIFHRSAAKTFVPSKSFRDYCLKYKIVKESKIREMTRGANRDVFNKKPEVNIFQFMKRPVMLYVGRVSLEKNIEDFLNVKTKGTKVVVGEGPDRDRLMTEFTEQIRRREIVFVDKQVGLNLAKCYKSSDVFVFPSKSDTFGIVIIEAMACGLPVAGYEGANGIKDIVENGKNGYLKSDLKEAIDLCLNDENVYQFDFDEKSEYSWEKAARQLIEGRG